jgi:hypothetical protein
MPAKTNRFSVRLEPEDSAMLQQLATSSGVSVSDVLRRMIRETYQLRLATMQTRSGFGFALGGLGLAEPQPPPAPKRAVKKKAAAKKTPARKH